jgi:hypothetical protein
VTYPVNFIQIIGLEDEGADNSLTGSGLSNNLDLAEKDVPLGLNGWGIGLLGVDELSTVGSVLQAGSLEEEEVGVGALGEIDRDGLSERWVSRAGWSRVSQYRFQCIDGCYSRGTTPGTGNALFLVGSQRVEVWAALSWTEAKATRAERTEARIVKW